MTLKRSRSRNITATWRRVGEVLEPFVTAFYTLPRLALAPLFLQWFGYGLASKVVMAALIAFFKKGPFAYDGLISFWFAVFVGRVLAEAEVVEPLPDASLVVGVAEFQHFHAFWSGCVDIGRVGIEIEAISRAELLRADAQRSGVTEESHDLPLTLARHEAPSRFAHAPPPCCP